MTQKDNLILIIEKAIDSLKQRIESYKKVDASLSELTLFKTASYLNMADEVLEKGFVKDSLNEVNNALLVN